MIAPLALSFLMLIGTLYNSLQTMHAWKENKYTLSLLTKLKDPREHEKNLTHHFDIHTIAHNDKGEIGFVQEIVYTSHDEFSRSHVFFKPTKNFVIINLTENTMQLCQNYTKKDLKKLVEEKFFEYIPKTNKMENFFRCCCYEGDDINKPICLIPYYDNQSAKKFKAYACNKNSSLIIGTAQIPYYYFFTTETFYLWSAALDDEETIVLTPITALTELDNYNYYTLITRIIFTENDKTIVVFLSDGTVLKIAV